MNTSTAMSSRESSEWPGRPRRAGTAAVMGVPASTGSLPRGAPLLVRSSLRCSRPCPLTKVVQALELPHRPGQRLRVDDDHLDTGADRVLDRLLHLAPRG